MYFEGKRFGDPQTPTFPFWNARLRKSDTSDEHATFLFRATSSSLFHLDFCLHLPKCPRGLPPSTLSQA